LTKRFTYNMNKNKPYESPAIRRVIPLRVEGALLAGSVVDKTAPIISNGQEVVDIDAGNADFDWNNNWDWSN